MIQRGGRPGTGTIVGFVLASIVFISGGVLIFWKHHSGASAHMKVVDCQSGGKSVHCVGLWPHSDAPQQFIPITGGASWSDVGHDLDIVYEGRTVRVTVVECHVVPDGSLACTGVAPPTGTGVQTMQVQGAEGGDVGHDIRVHVHELRGTGSYATADHDLTPVLMFAAGCVMAVCAATAIVRRRAVRQSPG